MCTPRTARGVRRLVRRTIQLFAALALVFAGVLPAQRTIDWSTKPVLLMTMGQGDEVFEKFGHNAIVVWDDAAGEPLAYNWGMFDFNQPNFLGRFLTGDTKYWMEPRSFERTMRDYQALNRTVTVQQLQLTPAQKTRLLALLAENATEENKFYRYDYYRDNCSTRARDAIECGDRWRLGARDAGTAGAGQLSVAHATPAGVQRTALLRQRSWYSVSTPMHR